MGISRQYRHSGRVVPRIRLVVQHHKVTDVVVLAEREAIEFLEEHRREATIGEQIEQMGDAFLNQ
jgi:hypothetical protein